LIALTNVRTLQDITEDIATPYIAPAPTQAKTAPRSAPAFPGVLDVREGRARGATALRNARARNITQAAREAAARAPCASWVTVERNAPVTATARPTAAPAHAPAARTTIITATRAAAHAPTPATTPTPPPADAMHAQDPANGT